MAGVSKNFELLPQKGDGGLRFLTLVVFMMTTLAALSLGGALVVQSLRATWVDATEGQITIEIPASDGKGQIRRSAKLYDIARTIALNVEKIAGVQKASILSEAQIRELVSPWMGESARADDLPLPVLIDIDLKEGGDEAVIETISRTVSALDAASVVETHQGWLSDLRRFSLVLLLAAYGMAAITIACCIVTVAGAVTARLSEHHSDIDLLHVMGATDHYIALAFIRSVVRSVGGAALVGTVTGFALLKAGGVVAGNIQDAVLPDIGWGYADYATFLTLPALVSLLCYATARITVLRSLRYMP